MTPPKPHRLDAPPTPTPHARAPAAPRSAGPLAHVGPVDLFAAALALGMLAVWYLQSLKPVIDDGALAAARRAELRDVSDEENRARDGLAALQTEITALRAQTAENTAHLRSMEDINARIAELDQLARAHALRLDSLRPETLEGTADYRAIRLSVGGEGTYAAVAAFLHRFRLVFPDVGLRAFEVARLPMAGPGEGARFALELIWFAAPEG